MSGKVKDPIGPHLFHEIPDRGLFRQVDVMKRKFETLETPGCRLPGNDGVNVVAFSNELSGEDGSHEAGGAGHESSLGHGRYRNFS
jgi:hypothetical protein